MALPLLRAGAASRQGRGKLDQDEPGARFHGSLAPSVGPGVAEDRPAIQSVLSSMKDDPWEPGRLPNSRFSVNLIPPKSARGRLRSRVRAHPGQPQRTAIVSMLLYSREGYPGVVRHLVPTNSACSARKNTLAHQDAIRAPRQSIPAAKAFRTLTGSPVAIEHCSATSGYYRCRSRSERHLGHQRARREHPSSKGQMHGCASVRTRQVCS